MPVASKRIAGFRLSVVMCSYFGSFGEPCSQTLLPMESAGQWQVWLERCKRFVGTLLPTTPQ